MNEWIYRSYLRTLLFGKESQGKISSFAWGPLRHLLAFKVIIPPAEKSSGLFKLGKSFCPFKKCIPLNQFWFFLQSYFSGFIGLRIIELIKSAKSAKTIRSSTVYLGMDAICQSLLFECVGYFSFLGSLREKKNPENICGLDMLEELHKTNLSVQQRDSFIADGKVLLPRTKLPSSSPIRDAPSSSSHGRFQLIEITALERRIGINAQASCKWSFSPPFFTRMRLFWSFSIKKQIRFSLLYFPLILKSLVMQDLDSRQ